MREKGFRDTVRTKLLKQAVTAPLSNARQQVQVPRVLGENHHHITVCVARYCSMAMRVEYVKI